MSELPAGFELVNPPPARPAAPQGLPAGFELVQSQAPATHAPPAVDAAHQQARDYLDAHPEAQPGWVSSMANKVGHGATLGFADNIASGLLAVRDYVKHGGDRSLGDYYRLEQAMQDELMKRATEKTGALGTIADIAGGVASGAGLLKGVGAVSEAVPVVSRALGALSPVQKAAAGGAALGGVQAAGDGANPITGAALGAVGGAAGQKVGDAVGGLVSSVMSRGKPQLNPMTTEQLRELGSNLYSRIDNAGGRYTAEGVGDLTGRLEGVIQRLGAEKELAPGVGAIRNILERYTGAGQMTPREVQYLRQVAGNMAGSDVTNKFQRTVGHQLRDAVDNFMWAAKPEHFAGGNLNPTRLAEMLGEANQTWQRYSKSEAIDRAIERATRQTAVTGSGGNIQNQLRQKLSRLVDLRKDWTPEEMAALTRATEGDGLQNLLRLAGKGAPGGNGLSMMLNLGGALHTGGATVPLTLAAQGAKSMSDRMEVNAANKLSEIVRRGGAAPVRTAMRPKPEYAAAAAPAIVGAKRKK